MSHIPRPVLEELELRILEEVQRLQGQYHRCAHCEAIREQIVRLLNLLPSTPAIVVAPLQLKQLEADRQQLEADRLRSGNPYVLIDDGTAILCVACGSLSYNPNDVANRYCPLCHVFHAA